jgi:hypothetical protein
MLTERGGILSQARARDNWPEDLFDMGGSDRANPLESERQLTHR